MGVLGNPFKLFGRLLIAGFRIAEYTATFIIQALWYTCYKQTNRIPDAYGSFAKSITEAIVDIFRN